MPSRVLIIDDNPFVRRTLSTLLGTNGFEVCGEAEDGLVAITKACELRPDLVLMDLVMPLMNGFEASREISRLVPQAIIVLHTLDTVPQVELEAQKNGISRVVTKSQGHVLISVLRDLVDSRPQSAAAVGPTSVSEPPPSTSTRALEPNRAESQSAECPSEANSAKDVARAS